MENEENENIRVCADCGRVIEEGDIYYNCGDDVICENCYCDNYMTCDCCEEVVLIDDAVRIQNRDMYVCNNCASDNYYHCNNCGDWFDLGYGGIETASGDYVCESCADDYYCCDECSEYYHEDDMNWNDETEENYCNNCMEQMESERIYSYHEFRNWILYKTTNENPPFYIGFELEIQPKDGDTSNEPEALKTIYDNLNAICSHDGSLGCGGFEIVSHPQSFNFIVEHQQQLQNTLNALIRLNYTSHDNNQCGLHFHVTRPENPEVIDRLWLILETYKKEILLLSRRTNSQIGRWAQFLSDANTTDAEKLKSLYYIKKTDKNCTRYMALNNENKKTIEFRFFKGTLKFPTFMACLEFINNLMTLCSNLSIPVEKITWDKLCDGLYIHDYIFERGIMANFAPIDKSLKIIRKENKEKALLSKIMRILKQQARELIQAENISKTNLKTYDDFKGKARELSKYYSDLYNNFFDLVFYLEQDIENMEIPDFIARLEYNFRNYNHIKGDYRTTIQDIVQKLKEIESEEI